MKKHIAELTGAALDWVIAKSENPEWTNEDAIVNVTSFDERDGTLCNYSTDWAQGGPIIEREAITIEKATSSLWVARNKDSGLHVFGQTPLIAAMRLNGIAYFGLIIDIPEELAGETA
jgi:hypothetical protein